MSIATDIEVLREMVRLAENRRSEQKEMIERIIRYNLGLIGFSGSYLSLMITVHFPLVILYPAGFFLLCSIVISLFAVRPQVLKGSTLLIKDDITEIRSGKTMQLHDFLLLTAELTENGADSFHKRAHERKNLTIISAALLAISLILTYILYAYA
jgi:hypothetical protein